VGEGQASVQTGPIGVLDSGVGGLSVLRELRRLLPDEGIDYVADQGHVPYAPRLAEEVRRFVTGISRFLLARGVKLIVVACNTASVAALPHLRRVFPETPFVGMDPAIKPAAAATRTGKIGVLATTGTFRSERYAYLVREFAQGVEVTGCPCPGLVEMIESGRAGSPEAEALLRSFIGPMQNRGVDTLVLGCTHFPLAREQIQAVAGPGIRLIDPAPAVARQVERVLRQRGLLAARADSAATTRGPGSAAAVHLFSTGDGRALGALAARVLGETTPAPQGLRWRTDGELEPA